MSEEAAWRHRRRRRRRRRRVGLSVPDSSSGSAQQAGVHTSRRRPIASGPGSGGADAEVLPPPLGN